MCVAADAKRELEHSQTICAQAHSMQCMHKQHMHMHTAMQEHHHQEQRPTCQGIPNLAAASSGGNGLQADDATQLSPLSK